MGSMELSAITSSQIVVLFSFFEDNAQLVNEILSAFRAPCFAIVGGDGGAGPKDLAGDVTALRRSGKL